LAILVFASPELDTLPTTREMDRSEAESKTKNYYKQLVKMK